MNEITEEKTGQRSEDTINMKTQGTQVIGRNNWAERSFRGRWKISLRKQAGHRSVTTITRETDKTQLNGRNNWEEGR